MELVEIYRYLRQKKDVKVCCVLDVIFIRE
jgi:hypothetical protein